ncbi:MAG: hypothetical protein E3J29_02535 [Dehalococcoidia bacterium]|nr:MAG: hypothetical protein E3J29_02535 [Dehalococcoidia bacterium]
MATREEIIAGLELTVAQGKRTTSLFDEGEWESKRACGWTPKEVYSHLASVAAVVPNLAQGLMNAPEDRDIALRVDDVDEMNARSVAAMASMTPEQVMAAFEGNYQKLIDFVKSLPDEQLKAKRRFFSQAVAVSDILANVIMLHGVHHVYEAASRSGAPA